MAQSNDPHIGDDLYPFEDWQAEVEAGDTMLGYYDWKKNMQELHRELYGDKGQPDHGQ